MSRPWLGCLSLLVPILAGNKPRLQAFAEQAGHAFDYRLLDVEHFQAETWSRETAQTEFQAKNAADRYTPSGK